MDRTVKSKILLGSTGVSRAGFGVPLILGTHAAFEERLRFYDDVEAVEEDFTEGSPELTFAAAAFGQLQSVNRIAIGRRDNTGVVAQVDEVAPATAIEEGDRYKLQVEGYEIADYTADANDTDATVAAELASQVNASAVYLTAEVIAGDALQLTGDWPGVPFDLTVTGPAGFTASTETANVASSETVGAALSAIEQENDQFYGVNVISRDSVDLTDAADWTNTRQKYFVGLTADADVRGAGDADVASQLKDLGLQKALIFHAKRPWFAYDAALISNRLSVNPDSQSTTWNLVQLVGVPTDNFTTTEEVNLLGKNVYYYYDDGAGGAGTEGKSIGGEWADVMIGIDWFNARLQEASYAFKKSATNTGGKVPYTDAGVTSIEAILRRRLRAAQDTDFIAEDPAPIIDSPRVLDVEPTQRQDRTLPPIKWNAQLAGAIHFTEFEGILTS